LRVGSRVHPSFFRFHFPLSLLFALVSVLSFSTKSHFSPLFARRNFAFFLDCCPFFFLYCMGGVSIFFSLFLALKGYDASFFPFSLDMDRSPSFLFPMLPHFSSLSDFFTLFLIVFFFSIRRKCAGRFLSLYFEEISSLFLFFLAVSIIVSSSFFSLAVGWHR